MSDAKKYLSPQELAATSGFCLSTINRLKKEGKIAYLQPGGPGSKVLFPADAMDQLTHQPEPNSVVASSAGPKKLAGVKPAWQRLQKGN